MKTQSGIRSVVAAFLAGGLLWGTAWAQETEPNNTMAEAQPLVFNSGVATINGTSTVGEPDIYVFWANAGDVITIDIDNGFHMTMGPDDTDLFMSLHSPASPAPSYTWVAVSDDSGVDDPGSEGAVGTDPYITHQIEPEASGYYYVAVTVASDAVADGGTFVPGSFHLTGGGTYTLIVSGASPKPAGDTSGGGDTNTGGGDTNTGGDDTSSGGGDTTTGEVQHVAIRIRPYAKALVRIDPRGREVIPVAILSTRDFDVRDVDVSTLTFGRTGDEQSLRNCNKVLTRVNRDRRLDLVCFFRNDAAGFEVGDEQGVLKGMTKSNTQFEGSGWLKVVPQKHHYGHDHGKGHHKDADNDRRKGHPRKTSWWSW